MNLRLTHGCLCLLWEEESETFLLSAHRPMGPLGPGANGYPWETPLGCHGIHSPAWDPMGASLAGQQKKTRGARVQAHKNLRKRGESVAKGEKCGESVVGKEGGKARGQRVWGK